MGSNERPRCKQARGAADEVTLCSASLNLLRSQSVVNNLVSIALSHRTERVQLSTIPAGQHLLRDSVFYWHRRPHLPRSEMENPWFMWCLILSCNHEIAGYVARFILYLNPWNFGTFITQISRCSRMGFAQSFAFPNMKLVCITQAPVFYCAAIYVLLGQT